MQSLIQLLSIYISGFGCLAFGLLTLMHLREPAKGCWDAGRVVILALSGASTIWFGFWLLKSLPRVAVSDYIEMTLAYISFLFPPLVVLAFYLDRTPRLKPRRFWSIGIGISIVLAVGCFVAISAVFSGLIRSGQRAIIGICYQVSFGWTAIYSILLMRATGPKKRADADEAKKRRWYYLLLALLLVMPWVLWPLFERWAWLQQLGVVFMRSMPLCFVFVGLYYDYRYDFFDLVVKRGLFFFGVFGVLLLCFGVTSPWMVGIDNHLELALILTVLGLPLILFTPYLHNRFSAWLDRIWLGRLYSPLDAGKKFLSDLHEVTTEGELIDRARASLSDIFQAEARFRVPGGERPEERPGGFESMIETTVRGDDGLLGTVRMGQRRSKMPYFSEDAALLGTLADILGRLLENIRLQERRKEQEQREKDLRLHASQSELKALRAQVNPHFLFNALNAIAGLIHQKPELAEETVEQLAEVFRYTLRRSEQEWVRLEDEIEFLKAYLEVERARFGDRLRTGIRLDDRIKDVRVPGMMVQTLVENAVKHGVANVRGEGVVEIDVAGRDGFVVVEVSDNGLGIDPSRQAARPGTGYGLSNIRRRLAGYYGSAASLQLTRDDDRGRTVAKLRFPVSPAEGARESAL